MPQRVIRDWTDSEKINTISSSAECLFVRLMMKADDFGNFHANVKLVKSLCFPLKDYRESDITRWMNELQESGLIAFYMADNKKYLTILNFGQRLRNMRNTFPKPSENDNMQQSAASCGECPPEEKRNETETRNETEEEVEIPPIIPQGDESDLFSDQTSEYDNKQLNTDLSKKVAAKKVFIAPSPEIVQEYCTGRQNGITGEEFVNFYQSKGWMVGKNKMKDWQAAVRTWEQSRKNNGKSNNQTGTTGNNTPAQQATYNIQEAAGRLAEDFAKGNIPGVYR